MFKSTLKSIWAVIAGALVGAVLSIITDSILESAGVFPAPSEGLFVTWMLLLATAYRTIYTALGGYVTARLAPSNPKRHVVILGILAVLANVIGLIATWGQNLGPAWYPILLAILAYPAVWYGGRCFQSK